MRLLTISGNLIRRWRIVAWLMVLMPFWAVSPWARPESNPSAPELSASVEKSAAKIGELLWLRLKYDLPSGARFPETPIIKGIEKLTVIESKTHDDEIRIRFLVDRLESLNIGPISLEYIDQDGNRQQIDTDPVIVTVESNLNQKPDQASLRPIQDIIPVETKRTFLYLGFIAAAIVLGLALFWLRQRIGRDDSRIPSKRKEPPHEEAEKAIDQLLADGVFERGDIKAFYFIFSEIIRRYMEAIRPFPAAEMTTEEIACQIGTYSQDQEILHLLRRSDMIKFADAVPTPERKDEDVRTARAYIRQNSPDPAPGDRDEAEAGQ